MTAFELYVKLGFQHIIDPRLVTEIMSAEGYDHLLFIIALTAVYTFKEYKKVLILVTAFTIGHSITLALSIFDLIKTPSSVIEFLIPLTIFFTAMFNVLRYKSLADASGMRLRYGSALVFGCIHGMGFSTYLKSLLGRSESIITPLLGFNIGIELGQLIIVITLLSIYFLLNKIIGLKRSLWIWFITILVLTLVIPILIETNIFW